MRLEVSSSSASASAQVVWARLAEFSLVLAVRVEITCTPSGLSDQPFRVLKLGIDESAREVCHNSILYGVLNGING